MRNSFSRIALCPLCPLWLTVFLCLPISAAPITLKNAQTEFQIDPATLEASTQSIPISAATESIPPQNLQSATTESHWKRNEITITAELKEATLHITATTDKPGKFTWPIIPTTAPATALILPTYEGAYAPIGDKDWQQFLIDQSPLDTTSGLIMPFVGIQFEKQTITYILATPYNNQLTFAAGTATFSHEFTPNQPQKRYEILVQLTPPSPIAPAKAYRQYLIDQKQFVSMKSKIEKTPNAARLLGAPHFYIWGDDLLSKYDVKDWKGFASKLASDDETAKAIFTKLTKEAQTQVHEMVTAGYESDYAENLVASELSKLGTDTLTKTFPDAFTDPKTWGDGISTKLLEQLHQAGVDRAVLTTADLYSAADKPQVANRANELDYLLGPYDSYDAVHKPNDPNTWSTAQFDQHLYDTGAVVLQNGTKKTGFKKKGFLVNPVAAQPYVEKRVNNLEAKIPFSSWFVDCDAFGELFDDYSPLHPATQAQFAQSYNDRLAWINHSHSLVIGSEGGTAFAAPFIHFAHGMMTPVIGWGDKDLTTKTSKYYLGAYYPPEGPTVFFKQVPLKPYYQKFFFDPRYRLPLYEIVFHDSVIATHHWSAPTLKFSDQVQTTELQEQLYNVPPMYHLNLAELKKRKETILAHYKFFSPLHRDLALQAMTDFQFLSEDKLVQKTVFADQSEIIANFSDASFSISDQIIPPHSVTSHRSNQPQNAIFTPKPQ